MNTAVLCGLRCGSCLKPIYDRYVMQVSDDEVYHESCLICSICRIKLVHTCFAKDSKFYCRVDYGRLYGKKCLACLENIPPEELVMRASQFVFHLRCFVCVVCGVRLQKGDQFIIKQGQLFCRPDYEKEVEMMQGFLPGDYGYEDGILATRTQDGRRGPKRPRTILTTQQRRAFKASFEISPKPCRKVRETLANDTGLSVRIVQVWFQNQRAKIKKIQKKAKCLDIKNNGNGSSCSNNTSSNGSDSEGILSNDNFISAEEKNVEHLSISTYLNETYDKEINHSFGTNTKLKENFNSHSATFYKPLNNEYHESQLFYNQTIDVNKHEEQEYDTDRFLSFQIVPRNNEEPCKDLMNNSTNDSLTVGIMNSLMNPIDRLYSMQTAYFCAKDPSPSN